MSPQSVEVCGSRGSTSNATSPVWLGLDADVPSKAVCTRQRPTDGGCQRSRPVPSDPSFTVSTRVNSQPSTGSNRSSVSAALPEVAGCTVTANVTELPGGHAVDLLSVGIDRERRRRDRPGEQEQGVPAGARRVRASLDVVVAGGKLEMDRAAALRAACTADEPSRLAQQAQVVAGVGACVQRELHVGTKGEIEAVQPDDIDAAAGQPAACGVSASKQEARRDVGRRGSGNL